MYPAKPGTSGSLGTVILMRLLQIVILLLLMGTCQVIHLNLKIVAGIYYEGGVVFYNRIRSLIFKKPVYHSVKKPSLKNTKRVVKNEQSAYPDIIIGGLVPYYRND